MIENQRIMGDNIQRHLDEIGMDRKEFAKRMNFPYSSVTDWINGKSYPRIDKIEAMANFFGCDKADLVENMRANITIHPDERELLAAFAKLNADGKREAIRRILEMTEISHFSIDMPLRKEAAR
jgi:predicted transcriptional regulator